jgi:hypothetical protein
MEKKHGDKHEHAGMSPYTVGLHTLALIQMKEDLMMYLGHYSTLDSTDLRRFDFSAAKVTKKSRK